MNDVAMVRSVDGLLSDIVSVVIEQTCFSGQLESFSGHLPAGRGGNSTAAI